MTKKQGTKGTVYSILISGMFPTNDPIAVDLLRLMSGCNDIYFIEEWTNGTKKIPKSREAVSVAAGRNGLQLRLMYSFLHESLCVLRDLKSRPQFEKLRHLLGNDGEKALTDLLSIKLEGINFTRRDWGINESILRARHTATVHYDFERTKEALDRWLTDNGSNEESYIVFREKSRPFGKWPYYSIADMARAEIAFGISNENHANNLIRALELMQLVETFTDCLFTAYIKDRGFEKFMKPNDLSKKI
jgi:hypothetical protein